MRVVAGATSLDGWDPALRTPGEIVRRGGCRKPEYAVFRDESGAVVRLGVDRTIDAIADAAERWRNADFPPRVRATQALCARTGYTEPVVDYALDALFGAVERTKLRTTIADELGSLDALEGFVARAGRPDVQYRGVERAVIVSSDTTIGVAIPAMIFALCANAHVVVKDRDDRLVAAFAQSIADERPELAERIATTVWCGDAGDDTAVADAHFAAAEVVVAYGGPRALVAIRARLAPEARFVPFGHRTSAGYVCRETLDDEAEARAIARACARDALLYDGEGCLSLHALFVETGGRITPSEFARTVADACDDAAVEFPAGFVAVDDEVAAYRRAALFRAAQGHGAVHAGSASPHLVVLDPPLGEPPPLLRRTLALYSTPETADALVFVRRHALPLEAIGISRQGRDDVLAFARGCGASRVAALGTLQQPPLGGEHGGEGRILPFVRAMYRT